MNFPKNIKKETSIVLNISIKCAKISGYNKQRGTRIMVTILGTFGFLLFFLYDWNSININNRFFKSAFAIGTLLLGMATILMIIKYGNMALVLQFKGIILLILTMVNFGLLIYTLFFALPFKETYIIEEKNPEVYDKGVYAICRHPGVIWLFFSYMFLSLLFESIEMMIIGGLFSFWNFLYIIFQDKYTFMKYFSNYDEYKKHTPFLIPNRISILRGIKTLTKRGTADEI